MLSDKITVVDTVLFGTSDCGLSRDKSINIINVDLCSKIKGNVQMIYFTQ